MELKEVVAAVTGGGSGLGEATVREIVNQGGKALILDLQEERGADLVKELGERVCFLKTDVTDEKGLGKSLTEGVEQFGKINVLINCAGVAIARKTLGRKGAHDLESFSKVVGVNLIGTFNAIRLTSEKMAENKPTSDGERGVIINTASIAAFDGQVGQVAYSASKGGIVGMTLPIARDLSEVGVRVMCIAPGLFETPLFASLPEEAKDSLGEMTPFPKRLGKPKEYADLVISIIKNSMLNGETIRLDGAIRMQPR